MSNSANEAKTVVDPGLVKEAGMNPTGGRCKKEPPKNWGGLLWKEVHILDFKRHLGKKWCRRFNGFLWILQM